MLGAWHSAVKAVLDWHDSHFGPAMLKILTVGKEEWHLHKSKPRINLFFTHTHTHTYSLVFYPFSWGYAHPSRPKGWWLHSGVRCVKKCYSTFSRGIWCLCCWFPLPQPNSTLGNGLLVLLEAIKESRILTKILKIIAYFAYVFQTLSLTGKLLPQCVSSVREHCAHQTDK